MIAHGIEPSTCRDRFSILLVKKKKIRPAAYQHNVIILGSRGRLTLEPPKGCEITSVTTATATTTTATTHHCCEITSVTTATTHHCCNTVSMCCSPEISCLSTSFSCES
jgi:hypothetical protein